MKKKRNILIWFLSVFMAISAIAFFPSFASVLMVLFFVVAVPIPALQDFLYSRGIKGWIKTSLLVVLFVASMLIAPTKQDTTASNTENPIENKDTVSEELKDEDRNPDEILINSSLDTSDYLKMDADILFEYGNYMRGEKVVTVITVYQVGSDIKAKTNNNDGYFFSISCEFDNKDDLNGITSDLILTVAGTIEGKDPLVDTLSFLETPTVTLKGCSIIGHGEIAQELSDRKSEQEEIGKAAKDAYEEAIEENKQLERDEYINQCETVKYSDVERNPDNYDGRKVKISGKVVQVSEGWFDSVTMRIDCSGNMWYVTYSREEGESRILEGDSITCYGECDGVTSYTTILGSQVTIPSLKMEYYD